MSVHSSKKTVEWMESKGFDMNFTPVYSPEWNDAVEKTISVIKQYVKRKRLSKVINDEEVDIQVLIEDAVNETPI